MILQTNAEVITLETNRYSHNKYCSIKGHSIKDIPEILQIDPSNKKPKPIIAKANYGTTNIRRFFILKVNIHHKISYFGQFGLFLKPDFTAISWTKILVGQKLLAFDQWRNKLVEAKVTAVGQIEYITPQKVLHIDNPQGHSSKFKFVNSLAVK